MHKKSPNSKSKGSNFGGGLMVGLLGGMAAYYMFGTKTGESFRKNFLKEYEKNLKQINKKLVSMNEVRKHQVQKKLEKVNQAREKGLNNNKSAKGRSSYGRKKVFTKSGRKLV